MKETNLFGNDFKASEQLNNKYTVTNFEYIPGCDDSDDQDGYSVDRVVMSFGDIATLSMYMYSGRFFWVEFHADERDILEDEYSRFFVKELISRGEYSTAVDYLINLHIQLSYKHLSIQNRIKPEDRVLQEMLTSVFSNEEVYEKAKSAFIKYINEVLLPARDNFSLDDLNKSKSLIDSNICEKELAVIGLNKFTFDDVKVWGELYKLNDVESVTIYTDDNKEFISLAVLCQNDEFKSRAIKVSDLKNYVDIFGSHFILCLLLEIFSSKEFNDKAYNIQGLLYDKSVVTVEQIKSVQLYSKIIKESNNGRFTENFCAIKLIADTAKAMLFNN